MHRTQVYLSPEQHRRLAEQAAREGVSLAALVRRAVAEYLDRREFRPPAARDAYLRIVGLGSSGQSDVAERHDHYLAEALSRGPDG
jgi:predicted transcriptional regulator